MNEMIENQNAPTETPSTLVTNPETALHDAMAAWTPDVGEIVILKSESPKEGVVLMVVENVFATEKPIDPSRASTDDVPEPELLTFVEVTWMAQGALLQRATFDQRALLPLDLMLEGVANELDGKLDEPIAPKKRRGRPPGTKNKPKRGKRKRRA